MNVWQKTLRSLSNLFLRSRCALCDRAADGELCPYCQRQVRSHRLKQPQQWWSGDLPLLVWGRYGGQLKRAIAALKYENRPRLARPLGRWLAECWRETAPIRDRRLVVVPVPLHPEKRRERGFNQAELLAESFCRQTRLKLQRRGLRRVKATVPQFGLSERDRETNLEAAFDLGPGLKRGMRILLLDDIYTTGATARSAAKVLRDKGIAVCGIVALATTKGRSELMLPASRKPAQKPLE